MTNPRIDQYGNKRWFNEQGQLHRTDGPAIIWSDGGTDWHINGRRHRTDGPALTLSAGTQVWYFNDYLHRLDGPAIVDSDDSNVRVHYWIHGNPLTETQFNDITQSPEHLNWYLLQL